MVIESQVLGVIFRFVGDTVLKPLKVIQVTPSYGGGNKSEILENAFSGIVVTSQSHTKVLTCGWREGIIKILKKATPALNNRSSELNSCDC